MVYETIFYSFDLLSTVVFAASGTLMACQQHRNVCTAILYGVLTAVGGGTLRDLILGQSIFWMHSPVYICLALSVALFVCLFSRTSWHRHKHFWLADGVSLAVFSIVGTQVAMELSLAPFVWPLIGVLTGLGGGILRDLLSAQMPYAVKRPYYMIASFVGSGLYGVLMSLWMPAFVASGAAIAIVMLILPVPFPVVVHCLKRRSYLISLD